MSTRDVRFGVNLMPPHWLDVPAKSGADLLAHRARLFRPMTEAGIDAVAELRALLRNDA